MLSQAVEDYLKAIFEVQRDHGKVATTVLAERMGVAPASATGMIKKLAGLKLLRHSPYQGVVLTRAGEKLALEVLRHHRLLELYLAEALGYTWDQVHDEACRLEHVISEEFEDKIYEALGRPTRDPHGEPIPTKDGKMPSADHEPLSDLQPGAAGVISQVSKSNPEILRYLGARGLIPEATVEVVEKAPFEGPLTVRTGENSYVLGRQLASHIRVEVGDRPMRARRHR
ncbi:MAG: iron (metal) dependent repressor, DtxR family [candidate division NC10 bacterium]|nr:iron (metal) dependent repressor, DtxR family [candidate division NC10 bacterium]MBS1115855.1 iron (metal) dependent repressor, DtxR family [candidate division NC10 bacterium]